MFVEFGDPTAINEIFTEDAEWLEPGVGPISGHYFGRSAIQGLFASVLSRSDGSFKLVAIQDVLANNDHGLVLALVEASRNGRRIRTTDAIVFDLREGRIARGRVLSEDQSEVDAFWD
jgi:ketosteroid isomerase-like protein